MKTDVIYDLFRKSAGVTTDSRTISEGQIFFALWGEKFNGNMYAAQAIEKGASWAVIDDPAFESDRTILVDDSLLELQALATRYRNELNIPVIAIVGTNGKTTTKELVASVLSKKFRVHYTKGNLNNQIGVPLTILSAPSDTEMMIIEMGANHVGEIRSLCHIANPDHGLLTNIGTAHIEGFGSYEGVVAAKTELYEYLRKVNGIAFYNDKDPILTEKIFSMINRAVPYSDPTGEPLMITEVPSSGMNIVIDAECHHKSYRISTALFGSYNLWNVKAAIATGLFFEVEMEEIVKAVEEYNPANNRSQVKSTGKNVIICDSYNANPSSISLAIDSFARLQAKPKAVILGDMFELGERSEEEHRKVAEKVKALKFDAALLAGRMFYKVSAAYGLNAFPDADGLIDFLRQNPLEGYHILVKGSRGMELEKTYSLL